MEGVPSYGRILVPLDGDLSSQAAGMPEGFPQGTTINYQQSVSLSAFLADLRATAPNPDDALVKLGAGEDLNLEGRHVVLHGLTDNLPGSVQTLPGLPNNVTHPMACGELVQVD